MTKKRATAKAISPRKQPRQRRAEETVAVIVEAAARILEEKGFDGFNTNAVAEKAGVSIGSLYQYFPGKSALLSAVIEREAAPLLDVEEELRDATECAVALRTYIQASIRHQMRRPVLARLIDMAERRELFADQVTGTANRLRAAVAELLRLPDAPRVANPDVAAEDVLAITRGLVDAAGERDEGESAELLKRVEGAVWGYLDSGSASIARGRTSTKR